MKKISLNTPIVLVFTGNYIHKTICKHLMNQGICSLRDLCMNSEENLKGLRGVKEKSIGTIKSILAEYSLYLGMDESQVAEYARDMPSVQLPKKDNNLPKIDWEQRRYEIAKNVYAAFVQEATLSSVPADETAKASVMYADCLILQLQIKQLERDIK